MSACAKSRQPDERLREEQRETLSTNPTAGFNFLEQRELPAPQVSESQARDILSTHYGLTARATSLGSQQDKNFIVTGDDGAIVGVLKIANPAFSAVELQAQDEAAQLIADSEPELRVAVPLDNIAGEKCTSIDGLVEGTAYVRLLRYLAGGTLDGVRLPDPGCRRGPRRRRRPGEPRTEELHPSRPGPDPAVGPAFRRSMSSTSSVRT